MITTTEQQLKQAKKLAESIMDQDMCNSPLAVSLAKLVLEMDPVPACPGPQSCAKTQKSRLVSDPDDHNFDELLRFKEMPGGLYPSGNQNTDLKEKVREVLSEIEKENAWLVNNCETFSPIFVRLQEYDRLLQTETNTRKLLKYIPFVPQIQIDLHWWNLLTQTERNSIIANLSNAEKRLALIDLAYWAGGLTVEQYDLFCTFWASPKFPESEIRKIKFVNEFRNNVEFRTFCDFEKDELFLYLRYKTGHFIH